jgi:hypothetical protein
MKVAWLALLLLGLQGEVQDSRSPLPQRPEGGVAGFSARSRLVYSERPEQPVVLETVYVFPDRARWLRSLEDASPLDRDVEYRFGEHVMRLPQGQNKSEAMEGNDRDDILRRMELRRAVFLWPDGFAWTGAGDARAAAVRRSARPEAEPIGALRAALAPGVGERRPTRIEVLRGDGTLQETLHVHGWREPDGAQRRWPLALTLEMDGRRVWEESLDPVQPRVAFLDAFFQPPDARVKSGTAQVGADRVRSMDLIPITFQRRVLHPETKWDEARTAFDRAWQECSEELRESGFEIERVPTFELDLQGRPVALHLRLTTFQATAPLGWSSIQERPGLALEARDLAQVDGILLEALTGAVPSEARAGIPYARLLPVQRGEERSLRIQVFLPLLSRQLR